MFVFKADRDLASSGFRLFRNISTARGPRSSRQDGSDFFVRNRPGRIRKCRASRSTTVRRKTRDALVRRRRGWRTSAPGPHCSMPWARREKRNGAAGGCHGHDTNDLLVHSTRPLGRGPSAMDDHIIVETKETSRGAQGTRVQDVKDLGRPPQDQEVRPPSESSCTAGLQAWGQHDSIRQRRALSGQTPAVTPGGVAVAADATNHRPSNWIVVKGTAANSLRPESSSASVFFFRCLLSAEANRDRDLHPIGDKHRILFFFFPFLSESRVRTYPHSPVEQSVRREKICVRSLASGAELRRQLTYMRNLRSTQSDMLPFPSSSSQCSSYISITRPSRIVLLVNCTARPGP